MMAVIDEIKKERKKDVETPYGDTSPGTAMEWRESLKGLGLIALIV